MGGDAITIAPERRLGPGEPTFVVAELGQNHNGRRDWAEALIDAAAWAGADAVKLIKRDLDAELGRAGWDRPYVGPHSFGATYGAHRRALELSADDHRRLARRARQHGLVYFATVGDVPSLNLMRELEVGLFKVASRDVGNLPFLERLATWGRPVLMSTGMSGWDELDRAVEVFRRRQTPLVLLQCTSLYPSPPEHVHLRSLPSLARRYEVPVGFSDHTAGIALAGAAVALGAVVLEKHLTLDRRAKGRDHAASIEPDELAQLVRDVRTVEAALGRRDKPVAPGVDEVRQRLGRSLVTRIALPAGAVITESALTLKCPGDGLQWLERERLVGRRLKRDLAADEQLTDDDVE